jgi:hypothetical protein
MFCVVTILVSILYYDPVILPDRQPGVIDGVEDLVFAGLFFVAAALLGYAAFGWRSPADVQGAVNRSTVQVISTSASRKPSSPAMPDASGRGRSYAQTTSSSLPSSFGIDQ